MIAEFTTRVWWRQRRRGLQLSAGPAPGFAEEWARWREPTVAAWRVVVAHAGGSPPSPPEVEIRLWRHLLAETSLAPGERWEGATPPAVMRAILGCRRPAVLRRLAAPIPARTRLTKADQDAIYRQGNLLWGTSGQTINQPHPLLEMAVTAMAMKEQYGIVAFKNIDEISQRDYAALRFVMDTYGEVIESKNRARNAQRHAEKEAGLRR